ncbi:MAG: prolyl oligopeptidase family serine peptidase [Acidobacteriota bacterium]
MTMKTGKRTFALLLLGTLALAGSPTRLPSQQDFTMQQILSAPFPTEMTASTGGAMIAWVQNAGGVRNIWVAGPPGYQGRRLTSFQEDDGQEITELEFAPDGKTLVYTRGGGPNRQGETPNPTSDPAGVEQAVWRVSTDGGQPFRIGAGSSAAVSPKGDGLAFLRRGQVFWAPLDGSKEPAQLVQARGSAGSLRWSPDGSRLAFVSSRGDHSFVGLYDLAAKSLSFLEPSVDRDSNPVWSPDGARLAFIRIPASSRLTMFRPTRSTQPWSIMVAEAGSKRGKAIWRASPGVGSAFYNIAADNQLFWGAGDRIVFPWERDGWLHLYSVPAAGGQAELLTPGSFEVENVILGPDRTALLCNSNQDDIDRRHLWRVPVSGGAPVAVTRGRGIEWEPVTTSDGKAVAFFRSDARRPAHAVISVGGGGERALAPDSMPADFPLQALVEPQQVIFPGADGMKIHGQLFRPPGTRPGERRAAVLFFHGGSRRQMLLGWHYRGYYHNAYALNQFLAGRGYVVLSVNYRSGTGYGMEFREAINYGAAGASEFNDVMGAGLYLRARADVDPQRIGLWGGSYGGYLTAMGLARASDLFAAGVDLHGVHDWNVGIRNFIPSYNRLEIPEEARLAFESSPMAAIDTWRSPVLVIHGDDDRNVAFSETVTLVEELRRRNVEVEQLVFPDEVHGFLLHSRWLEAYRAAADFFERKLGGQSTRLPN